MPDSLQPFLICFYVDQKEGVSKNSRYLSKELAKIKVMSSLRIKLPLKNRKTAVLVDFIAYLRVFSNSKAHELVSEARRITINVVSVNLAVHLPLAIKREVVKVNSISENYKVLPIVFRLRQVVD